MAKTMASANGTNKQRAGTAACAFENCLAQIEALRLARFENRNLDHRIL
ncbi:MAG TPA: hypothetical protein VGG72_06775 [Bryobacteraceae bacterium]|jgi:hypothetical protein